MMGPSLIFDKSTLQMLNPDESVWLDSFFIANVTPIFFVESLADLEKQVRKGRKPEDIVGDLAYKTPEMGCVNTFHENLMFGELIGQGTVEMKGRPILSGGQPKVLGEETGIVYEEPPEVEAFKRWQRREFLETERTIAKKWRATIAKGEFKDAHRTMFQDFFSFYGVPKNVKELKEMVDHFTEIPNQNFLLSFSMNLLGVTQEYQKIILDRWRASGKPPIKDFAPYFLYVISVDLFYYIGLTSNVLGNFPHAQTHRVDLTYIYYLPFCNIFTSNDKFHKSIAPLFMREDQIFISGKDLKDDLAKIDKHFDSLPEDTKKRGTMSFATTPPSNTEYWTTQMWDKFMASSWRSMQAKKFDGTDKIDKKTEKALTEKIQRFIKEGKPTDISSIDVSSESHSIGIKRMVSARKGKWTKLPPEILNAKNTQND